MSPWAWVVLALLIVVGVLTWLLLRNRSDGAAPQGHHVAGAAPTAGTAPAPPPVPPTTSGGPATPSGDGDLDGPASS
jgi:hypothetical protein